MSTDLFVTGMIRSGTSLVQVLLTNHPDAFVAYQPFHQLYVSTKARFLAESGLARLLPMSDGFGDRSDEPAAFRHWLDNRRFSAHEAVEMATDAVLGKGGSCPELSGRLPVEPGTFHQVRDQLLAGLADHFDAGERLVTGTKEVLCEEYLPSLADHGSRVLVVVRDPRGTVASAGSGSYLRLVGDRYPLLMLVRLWRKSAGIALAHQGSGHVRRVRYEDVATDPAGQLDALAQWLGLPAFPDGAFTGPLLDHRGEIWTGNSSYGPKQGVDAGSATGWVDSLDPAVAQFVQAACLPELEALGYPVSMTPAQARRVIESFTEEEDGVRPAYLELYRLDDERRAEEVERLETSTA